MEGALLKVSGVADADADHDTNTVEVECASSVTPEQLSAAVDGAGDAYQALEVTAE